MTPGALIVSAVFHGTLLAGAVYASDAPSEESGETAELVTFLDLVEPSRPARSESVSIMRVGGSDVVPPRVLTNAVVEGGVIAEFVVLPNGTVDLATVRIVSATHEGFEAATRNVLAQLRFTPGRLNGEPVPARTRLPLVLRVGGG